ncbi:3-keto-disaccharide hydrolase [Flavicella sediminum]|uniref:3-keto-disaccharide hydrolase n=1 Tax=Flavicella sediminum TaxID=2585141 RepID=UPI001122D0ED|nr:DUF1080 domain-containing protein [Flavicella sediminum]
MQKIFSKVAVVLTFLVAANAVQAQKEGIVMKQEGPSKMVKSKDWKPMLDKELSQWEVWTGVPHKTVKNLPKGYVVPEDGKPVAPIGLDNSMEVFKVTEDENGEPILNISGLIYAGLTSKKEYKNYHLTLLFKWGEKKYEPRLKALRDNGLLYHCYGEHGAFWNVWKRCLESQIQEGDFGDLYTLAGTKAKVQVNEFNRWDPKSDKISGKGKRLYDTESKHGAWTRVDLYVLEDQAIHVTNGKVTFALKDALRHDGKKLDKGQLQIQSEGAEAYAKGIFIRPIKKFPRKIRKAAGF